jgi:hypothetical protein
MRNAAAHKQRRDGRPRKRRDCGQCGDQDEDERDQREIRDCQHDGRPDNDDDGRQRVWITCLSHG